MTTKTSQRSLEILTRFLFVIVILIVLAEVAGAYTIVFKNGRRIEVPATFELGTLTVTYELAPGINRTLQLALIDIAATERANLETPGSFFKHSPQQAIASPVPVTQRASRTLTNLDLVPVRQRRIESEKDYEKRRIELGLPTVEETRERQAAEEEETLALARRSEAEDARNEAYWRDRATALRDDMNSVDAQIDYLRSRSAQNQIPIYSYGYPNIFGYPNVFGYPNNRYPNNGYPNVYGYPNDRYPNNRYPNVYGYPNDRYPNNRYPNIYGYPNNRYPNNGYPNIYGYPNSGSYPNVRQYPSPYGRRRWRNQNAPGRRPVFEIPLITPYTAPPQPLAYGNSFNQDDRLDDLMMRRSDLVSRWRALENDARNARVPQKWLLP